MVSFTKTLCCIVCFVVVQSLSAAGPPSAGQSDGDSDVERLQALLRELRELKTQLQKEKKSWESEKHQIALLLKQYKARAKEREMASDRLQGKVDALTAELDREKQKLAERQKRLDQIRKWTLQVHEALAGRFSENPFLGNKEVRKKLEELPKRTISASDLQAVFWNLLLKTASLGAAPRVYKKEILVSGVNREVTVLRLGAACEVFLTLDETTCGAAEVSDGRLLWKVLPAPYLDSVKLAVDVARKEVPAELIAVPFLRSRLVAMEKDPAQEDNAKETADE